MQPNLLATMVTTTSYGSWLPGDLRGYVDNGQILPANPARLEIAQKRMKGRAPILFSKDQQSTLFTALCQACYEFAYHLTDASIESWHLHWIVHHGFDTVATMVGRLKNRMRQALDIGRIWTIGYHDSLLFYESAIANRRQYIARHVGCRITNGLLRPVHHPPVPPGLH